MDTATFYRLVKRKSCEEKLINKYNKLTENQLASCYKSPLMPSQSFDNYLRDLE